MASTDGIGSTARCRSRGRRASARATVGAAAAICVALVVACTSEQAEAPSPTVTDAVASEPCDLFAIAVNVDDGHPELVVVESTDPTRERPLQPGWLVRAPAFSPDGQQIAVARATRGAYESAGPSEEQLWVMDRDGSDARALATWQGIGAPAWSPDGRWIAYTTVPGYDPEQPRRFVLYLADVEGDGEPEPILEVGPSATGLIWSPDGELLAFVDGNDVVTVRPDGTGRRVVDSAPRYSHLMWTADGRGLIRRSHMDHDVLVRVDLVSGEAEPYDETGGRYPRWSEDRRRAYVDGEAHSIDVVPTDGTSIDLDEARTVWVPDATRTFGSTAGWDVTTC